MPKKDSKQGDGTSRGAGGVSWSSAVGDEQADDGSGLRRFAQPVSDELVLVAVERAERHQLRGDPGVMLGDVFAHMGFIYTSSGVSRGAMFATHRPSSPYRTSSEHHSCGNCSSATPPATSQTSRSPPG